MFWPSPEEAHTVEEVVCRRAQKSNSREHRKDLSQFLKVKDTEMADSVNQVMEQLSFFLNAPAVTSVLEIEDYCNDKSVASSDFDLAAVTVTSMNRTRHVDPC